jgi:hypothetical protein
MLRNSIGCGLATTVLAALSATAWEAESIDNYALPVKTAFPAAMPRYPNAWFYIDASLAPSFEAAVRLVTGGLRQAMHLPEYYPPFDNPEGCDFEVRVEHLQPWIDPAHRSLQHAHAFHMRYYYNPLVAAGLEKVVFRNRAFYRCAASVHYEVGHANPNHADVEACPICGRNGEYAGVAGNLVERVHDPLGLELLLRGTIRGQTVHAEDWERRPVGSVGALGDKFRISIAMFPGRTADRNTERIGIVVLEPKP